MIKSIKDLFNWKQHPKRVFILALPLFFVGILLCMAQAYLQLRINGDWSYVVIVNVFLFLGIAAVSPLIRMILK